MEEGPWEKWLWPENWSERMIRKVGWKTGSDTM